jgi:hypothetical protein
LPHLPPPLSFFFSSSFSTFPSCLVSWGSFSCGLRIGQIQGNSSAWQLQFLRKQNKCS